MKESYTKRNKINLPFIAKIGEIFRGGHHKKKQSGNLACSSGGYRYSKIDKEQLLRLIQDKPDAYLTPTTINQT